MNMPENFFSTGPFMPHGGCYLWTTSLIALHAISDAFIVLAYYSIPVTLVYFIRKRKDLKFHWMFVCFAIFILACGTTHLMEIWNIWHANYWLSGAIKAVTAAASVPTAILLVKLIPQLLALPSPDALRQANEKLEQRVLERTREISETARKLEAEIAERQAAQEKMAWLATFPELNPNPIVELEVSAGLIHYANPAALRLFPDLKTAGLQHPFLAASLAALSRASRSQSDITRQEIPVDGRYYAQTITNAPGNHHLRIYSVEITERKLAEANRARLAAIVDSSEDAIISKTLDGVITSWNPGAEKVFGYASEEIIGRPMLLLFPPEKVPEEAGILQRIAKGESVRHYETVRLHKNGRRVEVSVSISPLTDSDGRIVGASKIARDITERKHAEARLRESEDRFASVFRDSPVAMNLNRLEDGRIIEVNDAWVRLTGFSPAEALGRTSVDLGLVERATGEKNWAVLRSAGTIPAGEFALRKQNGEVRIVLGAGKVMQIAGEPLTLGSMLDITERKRAESALIASEERYRTTLDNMIEGCQLIGFDWRYLYLNQAASGHNRRPNRELLGRKMTEMWPGIEATSVYAMLRRSMQERVALDIETEFEFPDGAKGWFAVHSQPAPEGIFILSIDISERKKAEAEAHDSEHRFRTMADSIPQLAWIARADGFIIWYNRRWYDYTGTTPEQMAGWGWQSVHDPGVLSAVVKSWTASIEAGQPFDMEFPLRGADGVFRLFLTRAMPFRDAAGNVVQWFGTNTDVEELKRVEQALRKSEASLAAAQTRAKIGNWEFDLKTQAGTWSAEMFRLFGRDPALGAPLLTELPLLLHPDDRASYERQATECMAIGLPYEQDFRAIHPDGGVRWMTSRSEIVPAAAGQPARLVGTTQDITERKLAEDEVRRLNLELEQRVIERTAQLETANKELEAFSYSVSHDLRAPLRAVNGFAGIVLEDYGPLLPEDGRRYLRRIRDGGSRMGVLIDDLLAFSRLSRQPLHRQDVDMLRLVHHVLDELKPQREGRELELRVDALPPCRGDSSLLKQVWINLLSNAIKYSRGRAPAVVEVGYLCERACISYFVRDNGTGFDMQYAHKLFGVFQRLHRADEFEGTGVGLAIVQRIIHRHGGRVWAEARENHGATFYFNLESEATL